MIGRIQTSTLVRILMLAAAYFVGGKLGLLLAIPPGYAAAIWPASGIAVAALLLFGSHLWPGILLGSFLVNLSIGYEPGNALPNLHTIATAAAIGIGAALQALLACYLVRRVVDFPLSLRQGRDVALFYVLAGPLACVTNATWGASVLVGLERIAAADFALTWWTWWVGDTIGVFIVTPVVMSWLAEPRELWKARRRSVSLPMMTALLAVIAIFFYASTREQERLQVRFGQKADSYIDAFQRNVGRYLEILYAVRSFYDSSNQVTREEFRTFVSRHLARNPGIHALSWNPVVTEQERTNLEAAARRDGIKDFRISERNSAGELVAASARDLHVVVQYIEPMDTNRSALGFDVASNPDRLVALELARDSDQPVATARINLVQETGMQYGILVFLPIYSQAQLRGSTAQHRRVLRGYVAGVFRVGDMLHAALEPMDLGKFDIRLDDHSASGADEVLQRYTTGAGPVNNKETTRPAAALSQVFRFNELGHDWSLHITERAGQWTGKRGWEAWMVSAGGLLFTSLLGAFLLMMTGRAAELALVNQQLQQAHDTLEQRVRERTAELIAAKSELEEHRDHLEELIKARTRELEAANDDVRSFTYIVSHDMRAPLVNIKGFTTELRIAIGELQANFRPDLLSQLDEGKRETLNELLCEEVPEALEFIENSANKLDGQINAILKLSRLGYLEFKPETVELDPLLHELLNNLAHQLETTKTSIKIETLPCITADRYALEQILGNLLDNAVKYLDKDRIGEISVSAEQHSHETIVHIQDTGRGISATDQPKIFGIFQRVGPHDQPGEGMGLAYVYSLVRRIGGRIWCESAPGKGSRFSVAFPKYSPDSTPSLDGSNKAANYTRRG